MACSSCGKARAAQSVQRNRNAGTANKPSGIQTFDSASVKSPQVNSAVPSNPNRQASTTRTKV